MVSPIKQYAPLDLTDQNKIINLGNPTDQQDATTKAYVDDKDTQIRNLVPLTQGGDMLYMDPLGSVLLSSQLPVAVGPTRTNEFVGVRVTGILTGHRIKVDWESYYTNDNNDQWLYGYATGGSAIVCSIQGPNAVLNVWTAQTATLTLSNGATEIILRGARYNRSYYRNVYYTDLDAANPARLPIGNEGERLVVDNGYPAWVPEVGQIEIGIDGHGTQPQTGVRADLTIPYDLTITGWTVKGDVSGSVQVDIWKSTLAAYPPVDAGSITGSDPPRLSSALTAASTALTGWSPVLVKGDCLRINLDSVSSLTRATVTLAFTKNT